MKTHGNESAYPEVNHDNPQFNVPTYGLTKREYFAAMALQGMIGEYLPHENDEKGFLRLGDLAVKAAKALIIELNKEVAS